MIQGLRHLDIGRIAAFGDSLTDGDGIALVPSKHLYPAQFETVFSPARSVSVRWDSADFNTYPFRADNKIIVRGLDEQGKPVSAEYRAPFQIQPDPEDPENLQWVNDIPGTQLFSRVISAELLFEEEEDVAFKGFDLRVGHRLHLPFKPLTGHVFYSRVAFSPDFGGDLSGTFQFWSVEDVREGNTINMYVGGMGEQYRMFLFYEF